jgi:CDP-diacylglycerol--glycerol-3-phosphate 3-phosphatidyltransferase
MTSPAKVQEPKTDQPRPSRLHLIPNKITLFRVLLAPILVMLLLTPGLYNAPIAALVIALGSLTDWLDGHLARRWAVESDFGRLLDPIADKLILVAALVPLAAYGQVPAWMAVLLIGREVAVTVLRSIAAGQGWVISANDPGKYKTAFQMVALIFLILDFEWGWLDLHLLGMIALWIALLLSLYSGGSYFRQFWRQVNS